MITRLDTHMDQAGAWDVMTGATGRLAFNIGANIGQAARVLADGFDHVVALEPCRESYEILAAEMPPNVTALEVAAADHDGFLVLEEASRSISTGQLVAGEGLPIWGERIGTRRVRCTTLDSLHRTYGPPDFVNIDTEGSEVTVLTGAGRLLAEARPRLLVEMHRAEHNGPVRELLAGYRISELRHGDYVKPGGAIWTHHYWLVGEPDA